MYFSNNDLNELQKGRLAVASKCQRLMDSYLTRNYKDSRAREYAEHGFLRRLKTMARCIDNTFRILPPDRAELPTMDDLFDAMINIQAFTFNSFGSIDNLAWIWGREHPVLKANGSEIDKHCVGLRKRHTHVRRSLSTEFQEYLKGLDGWFDHLEEFRDALAHRIPLYIPPHTITRDKEAVYRQLPDLKIEALRQRDRAEHQRLEAEQSVLGTFEPMMRHSFEEGRGFIKFHPQLLTDFLAIEGLAQKLLAELDP